MENEKDQCLSKRQQQKEARRNDIIEAGLRAFTAQGFTSTRLDDVAERAGIGKGTIYLYFDSKESLFEEVVRKNLVPGRDQAISLVEEFKGSATELLTLHMENMYDFIKQDNIPSLLAVVIGESGRFPEMSEFFFKEIIDQSKGALSSIIRKGIESGEFQDVGVDKYCQIIVSPTILGSIWKKQFDVHSPVDMDDYAKTHIAFVLNGLRT